MRKYLIAANWKMNPPPKGWDAKDSPYRPQEKIEVVVFPTHLDLQACAKAGLTTGAQSGRPEQTGAFTGDVSMQMVQALGCRYVLCGHSDRRAFHLESDAFVAEQAAAAITHALIPIICIGETETERDAGKSKAVIERQVKPLKLTNDCIIAYEPVWAISRGDPNRPAATSADAEEMHAFIRSLLPKDIRDAVRLLYGGSMKASNAKELLAQPNIDGGLVGGASLKPEEFREIVKIASEK